MTMADRLGGCSSSFSTYASAQGAARVNPHRCDLAVCPRCIGHRTRATRARFDHHAERTCSSSRPSQILTAPRWASAPEYEELLSRNAVRPFPGDELPRQTGHPVRLRAGTSVSERGMVRLITLTQPVRSADTWTQARARLLRQWARFWRSKRTRAKIDGGMRRVETTWSSKSQGWHVHIHFAAEGDRWEQADLVAEWQAAGEGSNVDIRQAGDPAELFKYLLKTSQAPAARLVEYARESRRARNLEMVGTWRDPIPEPTEPEEKAPVFFLVDAGAIRAAASDAEDAHWRVAPWRPLLGPDVDPARWARSVWASRREAVARREDREVQRMQGEIRRRVHRMKKRRESRARRKNGQPPGPHVSLSPWASS